MSITTTRLLNTAGTFRRFSTVPTASQMFVEAWSKVSPNTDPPKLPLTFMQPKPPFPGSIPNKLTINFYLRYSFDISTKQVDMITVPATTGQMSILPGHMASMTELNPGVLSLHEGNETTKYFISGGFALTHPNSVTDLIAEESVPIERIDPDLVQKGLADFSQKLSSSTSEYEKVEAQVGVYVHTALSSALIG
ncbi:ATP synthase subunit delta', mitochondrial-like [Silene latifolia]|uniref:ATP synthase subunit delta', mitochondrial-like n=1 Tax=Silene latifolia TaxID=37657 RepID=UPI003D78432B